jgi:hypothetical protein
MSTTGSAGTHFSNSQLTSAPHVTWQSIGVTETHSRALVDQIVLVALKVSPDNHNERSNDWVASLRLRGRGGAQAERAVEVNISPGADLRTGVVTWAARDYVISPEAEWSHLYETINEPTVQIIEDLVRAPDSRGQTLERYKFTVRGVGCAWWVYNLFWRVEKAGYLPSGRAKDIWAKMSVYYEGGVAAGEALSCGTRQGEFY